MLRNIRLLIEYDGTHFSGWQTQPHKRTIQETIEKVLHRVTQEKIHLAGASRTDAGVHALGQVANFHTRSKISCSKLLVALNGLLPSDMAIRQADDVGVGTARSFLFHANKNAKRKTYQYLIWNSPARNALLKDRAWHVWIPLRVGAIQKGARYLLGRHDFSAFRGTRSDTRTSLRTIYSIRLKAQSSKLAYMATSAGIEPRARLLQMEITGTGFLKYMVRNIVGTLVEVGKGRLKPEAVKEILRSKDRKKAGVAAPACGLYLIRVFY